VSASLFRHNRFLSLNNLASFCSIPPFHHLS
jgi:hypothetical protein